MYKHRVCRPLCVCVVHEHWWMCQWLQHVKVIAYDFPSHVCRHMPVPSFYSTLPTGERSRPSQWSELGRVKAFAGSRKTARPPQVSQGEAALTSLNRSTEECHKYSIKNKTVLRMLLVALTPNLVKVTEITWHEDDWWELRFERNKTVFRHVLSDTLSKLSVGIKDRHQRKYLPRPNGLVSVAKLTTRWDYTDVCVTVLDWIRAARC